jgi:hypothetical protein
MGQDSHTPIGHIIGIATILRQFCRFTKKEGIMRSMGMVSIWKETCGDLVASCGFGQRAELDLVAELGDLGATGEKVSCSAGRPEAGGELFCNLVASCRQRLWPVGATTSQILRSCGIYARRYEGFTE